MSDNKKNALTGENNKRLSNMDVRNSQQTFPLTDVSTIMDHTNLTFPPQEDVIHAKEWVDNGSRL